MADVMIAVRTAMVRVDGDLHKVRRRRTTAHADAVIVVEHPELWEPLRIDFPAEPKPELVAKPKPRSKPKDT